MKSLDKPFLIIVSTLILFGLFIFSSASMGLLTRTSGATYASVFFSQIILGLLPGLCAMVATILIPYAKWRKYSFFIFLAAIVISLLVFTPGIGFAHGGARRWIEVFGFSFQPSEFFKIGFVIYFAAWLAKSKDKVSTFSHGLIPLCVLLAIVGAVILTEPDTDTFLVILLSAVAMFLVAGGRWRHVVALIFCGILAVGVLTLFRPYLVERFTVFLNPLADPLGSGYQIKQSLIAVGSGQIFGRGFGQSIQKFNYLPEPIGDSVFAVAAEEFGFVGSVLIVLLFAAYAWRGFWIAGRAPDVFSRLTTVGIVILIVSQSFMNIAAMLAVMPLSGTPLLFVSHGGTALLFALAESGIILNVSRFARR